ncbi:MAG TPA: ubiquinone/menaquinone biosynthesis methyltransferase [Planctomycetota bacterium]|jgi:demethylmenaquinone methyltransferase/2-methoxy-6-polyprenyl-1,4-benzoquinol methylase
MSAEPATLNPGGKSGAETREMFARVARRYDLLNHLLSLGLDIRWRKLAAREARGLGEGDLIADLCAGTGDLALAMHDAAPQAWVLATDFTPEMASLGLEKIARKKIANVSFALADALALPLRDESAALACVAFGIRNVVSLRSGLQEMIRVVRPGGKVVVLEFTRPTGWFFGPLYMFYFRRILPLLGRVIAKTAGDAYRYLPQSVQAFAGPEEMSALMRELGLRDIRAVSLSFGAVHLYVGIKC